MKKSETVQIITLLAANYESIANKSQVQKELMLDIWQECLGDLDYNIVLQAVKKVIIQNSFPPTIHDIREKAMEMINPLSNRTAIEAWNEAYGMICNGLYMTEEEFDSHSDDVKNFFRNVRQVKELAATNADVVNSVTKGQFLKQYEMLKQREHDDKLIPESMKTLINSFTKKLEIGGTEDE